VRRIGLGLLLFLLLAAPPAAGQDEEGVFVDPESPAGKEYAIPLEQARREATPDALGREGGAGSASAEQPPLFGMGIGDGRRGGDSGSEGGSDAGAIGDGPSGGGRGHGGGPDVGDRSGSRDPASAGGSSSGLDGRRPAAAANGSSASVLTGAIGVAVLGAGVLVGFGLRRLLGPPNG
jgi:hypothetical protein